MRKATTSDVDSNMQGQLGAALALLESICHASRETDLQMRDHPGDPDQVLLFVNGELTTYTKKPEKRTHRFDSLESLLQLAADLVALEKAGTPAAAPQMWYRLGGVKLLFDRSKRDEWATFPLTTTPQWDRIKGLQTIKHGQKGLIQLLNRDLYDCAIDPSLILLLTKLKLQSSENSASHIGQGNEALGSDVLAKVTGADDQELPESFTCKVRMFVELEFTLEITLALDINLGEPQPFRVPPMAGEIERCEQAALVYIEDEIDSGLTTRGVNEDLKLYCGSPR